MQSITIRRPDDMHLHLRDGAALEQVAHYTAAQFSRAIIMPNLRPPVTTTELAVAYRKRILDALPKSSDFEPLMTLYLTEKTTSEELRKAKATGMVQAVKYYPAGATTNSDSGVTDMSKVYPLLETMAEIGLPLCIHGEVTDSEVDIFEREAIFIDTILAPLLTQISDLNVIFEHITTSHAVQFVESMGENVAATITPQHCLMNRNALFEGGLRPHRYCLPVLKAEAHREAVFTAATSGNKKFFLGTDSAPHAQSAKEHSCGCAGIFSAFSALEFYAEIFAQADALNKLENFASVNGAEFYGLPLNEGTVTLQEQDWQIPEQLPYITGESLIPYYSGETIRWKFIQE